MEKWADYLISAVRYEETLNSKIISYFKIHHDNGDSVGEGSTWTKQEVLEAMLRGLTFVTIQKTSGGKWKQGKRIYKGSTNVLFLNVNFENLLEHDQVSIAEF